MVIQHPGDPTELQENDIPAEVRPGFDWYDLIEDGVREVVRLLRNNGFNTTCSCHHSMTIEMEWYKDEEITALWNLLVDNGYDDFLIEATWATGEDYAGSPGSQRLKNLVPRCLTLYLGKHGAKAFKDNQQQRE